MSGKEDEVFKVNAEVIPGVWDVFCDEEIAGDYFGHLPWPKQEPGLLDGNYVFEGR